MVIAKYYDRQAQRPFSVVERFSQALATRRRGSKMDYRDSLESDCSRFEKPSDVKHLLK